MWPLGSLRHVQLAFVGYIRFLDLCWPGTYRQPCLLNEQISGRVRDVCSPPSASASALRASPQLSQLSSLAARDSGEPQE